MPPLHASRTGNKREMGVLIFAPSDGGVINRRISLWVKTDSAADVRLTL